MTTEDQIKAAQITILRSLAKANPVHAAEIEIAIQMVDGGAVTYSSVRALLLSAAGI